MCTYSFSPYSLSLQLHFENLLVGVGFGMNQSKNNNMPIGKTQRIACRICEQIFSTPQTLISHIESYHVKNDFSPQTTTTTTGLSSFTGKPLSLTLNLVSSAISVGAKTPAPAPSSTARSPFLYNQNLYNHFPAHNHVDLNHYRSYLFNPGRLQNGFPAAPPLRLPATTTARNSTFVFGQTPPPQMQFLQATSTPSGDRTLNLLCQLEHRSPDVYVPIIVDDDSDPDLVDLTLKL